MYKKLSRRAGRGGERLHGTLGPRDSGTLGMVLLWARTFASVTKEVERFSFSRAEKSRETK